MGKRNLSDTKVSNIKKLRGLGYTVKRIAELTGVSTMTVNDYTLPGFYQKRLKYARDYLRRTVMLTGSTKEGAVLLRHLNKRPYSDECELCGKLRERHHHYHHWDDSNPSMGLWLCFKCHRMAELMDSLGPRGVIALMSKYERRKIEIADSSRSGGEGNSSKNVSET